MKLLPDRGSGRDKDGVPDEKEKQKLLVQGALAYVYGDVGGRGGVEGDVETRNSKDEERV